MQQPTFLWSNSAAELVPFTQWPLARRWTIPERAMRRELAVRSAILAGTAPPWDLAEQRDPRMRRLTERGAIELAPGGEARGVIFRHETVVMTKEWRFYRCRQCNVALDTRETPNPQPNEPKQQIAHPEPLCSTWTEAPEGGNADALSWIEAKSEPAAAEFDQRYAAPPSGIVIRAAWASSRPIEVARMEGRDMLHVVSDSPGKLEVLWAFFYRSATITP